MKYFAYGSNLNKTGMRFRCPNATPIGKYKLEGYRLTFRGGLPDILPHENGVVTGGLWEITERCEMSLDRYEGFPNLYDKHSKDGIMFYRMVASIEELPEDYTTKMLLDGCTDSQFVRMMLDGHSDFDITEDELRESIGCGIDEES